MAFSIRTFTRNLFRPRPSAIVGEVKPNPKKNVVGANSPEGDKSLTAFENSNITYRSPLADVDYDGILRDKQGNINTLYQLADYYTDADPIVRGIIKGVYVPFSDGDWFLTCDNEKTIDLFEEQYKKMRLREKIEEIFLQYWKYGNVYVYIWKGHMMTLAPHKCKISNIALNGTPIVDYDVQSITNEFRQRTYSVLEAKGVKDDVVEDVLKGYPPEIAKAVKAGTQYATLNPENVFVLQNSKEGWMRYAVPWIAAALPALAKKELIDGYESSLLNLGTRSFVHVSYGDDKKGYDMLPNLEELTAVRSIFSSAMSGNPLAVTNQLAKPQIIQADLSDLYQFPMYEQVNADILAAGGIAGIIVNGTSEDGSTFASAQVSMHAATARIEAARREVEEFMNKVNYRLVEDIRLIHTNNLKNIPEFHFKPFDMSGNKALREACQTLWTNGIVSTRTMLEANGYSLSKEKAQRQTEASDGTDTTMINRQMNPVANQTQQNTTEEPDVGGRPKKSDDERQSEPESSVRSKQVKEAKEGNMTPNDASDSV